MPWYHTTPYGNVPSIERDGLRLVRGVVHLSQRPEVVLVGEFTQNHRQTCDCPDWHVAVFEVDVDGLEQDCGWDPVDYHLTITEPIPPSRLRRIPDPPRCSPCTLAQDVL